MAKIDLKSRQKRKGLERFLDGEYVLVQVIPSIKGVDLPPHLKVLPSVTLKLSRLFRGKMEIDNDKIVADLLFNGSYYTCIFPYAAIWSATGADNECIKWEEKSPIEDVPFSEIKEFGPESPKEAILSEEEGPSLDEPREFKPDDSEAPEKGGNKVRPMLRRVK
jgi:stringent starvation protein B